MRKILTELEIEGIKLEITQKIMKNMRIRISPPLAKVKVSAPLKLSLGKIEEFVRQKINWIKASRAKILSTKYEEPKKIRDGEYHYFFGRKLLLRTNNSAEENLCFIDGNVIRLHSKKFCNFEKRQKLLDDFYRRELQKAIPPFIKKLERRMNVSVREFRIRKMKTRWGTCSPRERRIWLNLELAKTPLASLEYLVAHEMAHFFEIKHNKRFFMLLDKFLPEWKKGKNLLSKRN